MYHAFVRSKITDNFRSLGKKPAVVGRGGLDPRVEHVFAGAGAIGGRRHSAAGFGRWLTRVYRLFPDLHFEVRNVVVSGWPWDTTATVEWHSEATTATGQPYANDGVHVIRLKLGKIVSMHVYHDTARVERTLRLMAEQGCEEAAAAPIED